MSPGVPPEPDSEPALDEPKQAIRDSIEHALRRQVGAGSPLILLGSGASFHHGGPGWGEFVARVYANDGGTTPGAAPSAGAASARRAVSTSATGARPRAAALSSIGARSGDTSASNARQF